MGQQYSTLSILIGFFSPSSAVRSMESMMKLTSFATTLENQTRIDSYFVNWQVIFVDR